MTFWRPIILIIIIALPAASWASCDDNLSFYHRSIAGKEYTSGFRTPSAEQPVEETLERINQKLPELIRGPLTLKATIKKMNIREKILWLHEFSFSEAEIGAEALKSENPKASLMFAVSPFSTPVIEYLTDQVVKNSNRSLLPYVEELKAILTNLTVSLSGLDASLELQIKLASMAKEIDELKPARNTVLLGIIDHIAAEAKAMSPKRLTRFKASLEECLANDKKAGTPSIHLLMISNFMIRGLDQLLDVEEELSPSAKDYLRYLVDILPKSFDVQNDTLNSETAESYKEIFSVFLEKARQRPDLLNAQQIAVVEFLRDGIAGRR